MAKSDQVFRRYSDSLLSIVRREALYSGDIDKAFYEITEAAANTLNIERSSIWLYADNQTKIRCTDLYERGSDCHSEGAELTAADFPAYFAAMDENRVIDAHDAHRDPRTREFSQPYLTPLGITSMLDAPIHFDGQTIGVICQEHIGQVRRWTPEEITYAGSLADLISHALVARDRKQAEEALRESEDLLNSIFENVPVGLLIKDPDHIVERANRTYLKWYGFDADTIVGRRSDEIEDFQSAEEAEFMNAQEREVLTTGLTQTRQVDRPFADGQIHTIAITKFPVYDQQGKITKVGSVSVDLTEQIQAQIALAHSEMRFRDFAESSSDWFWEMDENLCFSYFSDRFADISGVTEKDLVGKTRQESGLDMEDERARRNIEDLEARRPFKSFEHSRVRPDGSVVHMSTSGMPLFDEDGAFKGYRGTGTDITEQKRSEEALRDSETRLRNILDNSPTPIYFKDTKGRFLVANRQYEENYGIKFEDIKGKTSLEIFPGEQGEQFYDHDMATLKKQETIVREEQIDKNTYVTSKFPILADDGELIGLGGVEVDISERLKVENELKVSKEAAEKANRAKSDFLAHMSHELRTPLNSILGFSQTITEEVYGKIGNDKYMEYIEDIHNSGHHLLHLINDILDLSKIEAGEFMLDKDGVDLDELLSSCLRMIQGRPEAKSVSIRYDPSGTLPHIWADERLVKQIVLNLLSNAVKYNVEDGTVHLSASVDQNNAVSVVVSDTGVGIAAENIPKVLEPFGQARSDAQKTHEGTGLGLSLSKQLAELHGGTLELESELGKGTTVIVMFPPERIARS